MQKVFWKYLVNQFNQCKYFPWYFSDKFRGNHSELLLKKSFRTVPKMRALRFYFYFSLFFYLTSPILKQAGWFLYRKMFTVKVIAMFNTNRVSTKYEISSLCKYKFVKICIIQWKTNFPFENLLKVNAIRAFTYFVQMFIHVWLLTNIALYVCW